MKIEKYVKILIVFFIFFISNSSLFSQDPGEVVLKFLTYFTKQDFNKCNEYISDKDYIFLENFNKEIDSSTTLSGKIDIIEELKNSWKKKFNLSDKNKNIDERIKYLQDDINAIKNDIKGITDLQEKKDLQNIIDVNNDIIVILNSEKIAKKENLNKIIDKKIMDDYAIVITQQKIIYKKKDYKKVQNSINNILKIKEIDENLKKQFFWKKNILYVPFLNYLIKDNKNNWKIIFWSQSDFPVEKFEDFIIKYKTYFFESENYEF